MSETKISLSPVELDLAMNASVILTKNAVMEKTKQLLNRIQDKQEKYLIAQPEFEFPVIPNSSPKISRGENYRGLPYMVLDYPRIFEKDATIAIRTIFWWGNFFSVTLHLSGKYKKGYETELLNAYYEELVQDKPFVKIAYKFPLDKWNEAEETCYRIFVELVGILDQAPKR